MFRALAASVVLIGSSTSAQPPAELTLVAGKFGKALDAKKSPVQVAGNPAFRQPPLTVECWAKLRSKDGYNILVASDHKTSGQHWELFTKPGSGHFTAYLRADSPDHVHSTVDVCDGRWHHLAMTHDGQSVRLFVDGKVVGKKRVKRNPDGTPEPGPLTIGQAVVDQKDRIGCDGLIDELRISNAVREITGVPTEPPELDQKTVGLWRFDLTAAEDVDPAWTPRPAVGDAPPWEKETDPDWVDDRLQKMDTGPFFNATVKYPGPKGDVRAFKGTAIKLPGGGALFDRNRLRWACAWTGGFLKHSSRRFGLLNTPQPAGDVFFATTDRLGVGFPRRGWEIPPETGPSGEAGRFRGLYRHGDRIIVSYTTNGVEVLDSPGFLPFRRSQVLLPGDKNGKIPGADWVFTRTLWVAPSKEPIRLLASEYFGRWTTFLDPDDRTIAFRDDEGMTHVVQLVAGFTITPPVATKDKISVWVTVPPGDEPRRFMLRHWHGHRPEPVHKPNSVLTPAPRPDDLRELTRGGRGRWPELVTRGEIAEDDAAYVVDTLTIPYENPFDALFFCSGVDFLPDGRAAVCTAHGDVWLVGGIDDSLKKITWQRFATGLYQPLGLKVVDGKVIVLERGQLTRLHDINADGEADYYECFCGDWHVGGGEHSFHSCLETDPEGNFYFFSSGDTETPTGGCLMRVAADGSKAEIFCTGFRHPIGLGASPDGIISGADQEGNWMPATRIDLYRKGGFYGDMRAHHRKVPPETYDPPLCWLPRQMDNSAGGQVWAPKDGFGPLSGQMLHLSYGKCKLFLVMTQTVDGVPQGGAVDVGLQFLSGSARGRFRPDGGHLYVAGLDGWQTAAVKDGCLQRVRYTGKPVTMPVGLSVHENGIRIRFSSAVSAGAAKDWQVARWNYRWSGDYGSKRWSLADPDRVGEDILTVKSVESSEDGRSVFLRVDDLRPVMQMEIRHPSAGVIYHTAHRLAPALNP